MQNSTLGMVNAVTLAIAISLAGLAFAQESGEDKPGAGRGEAIFLRFDTDQDGKVTLEEFEAVQQDRFASADADGDGSISREEMLAAIQAKQNERAERIVERMFARLDADEDGALSAEEMPKDRAAKIFTRLDADGDGSITLAELGEMRRGFGHGKHQNN